MARPTAPVVLTPAMLAEEFWRTIKLPVPAPNVPPGWAITGKTAYLEAGDPVDPAPYRRTTPLGPLVILAHATTEVDWGDGQSSGPYTTAGGPYPDGTITHVYDVVGRYDLRVTQSWTATWRLDGAHGALGGLRTTAAIPGFDVRQVQAVITGGD